MPARPPRRDDAHVGVQQQVEGDPLLRRCAHAAPNASRSPRTSRTALSGADPARARSRGARAAPDPCGRAARRPAGARAARSRRGCPSPRRSRRARPCRSSRTVDGQLGAVLLGFQADRRRLDPHRQVLAHDGDVASVGGQVLGYRKDAGVVVTQPEPGRQDRRVGVVELDLQRPPERRRLDRAIQAALGEAQLVEQPQRLAGEVAELRMVALAFQLGDRRRRAARRRARRSAASREGPTAAPRCRARRSCAPPLMSRAVSPAGSSAGSPVCGRLGCWTVAGCAPPATPSSAPPAAAPPRRWCASPHSMPGAPAYRGRARQVALRAFEAWSRSVGRPFILR